MREKVYTILESLGRENKYAVHLRFKDMEELNKVAKALEPLGYTFRFPIR